MGWGGGGGARQNTVPIILCKKCVFLPRQASVFMKEDTKILKANS